MAKRLWNGARMSIFPFPRARVFVTRRYSAGIYFLYKIAREYWACSAIFLDVNLAAKRAGIVEINNWRARRNRRAPLSGVLYTDIRYYPTTRQRLTK